jgi:AraC family transcriptional regulator
MTGVPTVRLFRTDAPRVLARHGHDEVHLCLLLDGAMIERNGPGEVELAAGGARVSPSGDEHRIRFGPAGGACAIAHFPRPFLADLGLDAPRERRFLTLPAELLARARAAAVRNRETGREPGRLEIQELAVDLLLGDARGRSASGPRPVPTPGQPPPLWLVDLHDRLRDEPDGVGGLRELAEAAGVHPGHLTRAFRAHFGCPPSAFLRWRRLVAARRRIATSDEPLAAVAHACGFADQPHMTRWFRRAFGVTPARLRARKD